LSFKWSSRPRSWGSAGCARSSRGLEAATKINLEAIWLTGGLHPDHSTISEFRKANAAALPGIFSAFTVLCVELGLYGRELVAIDGTFIKAVNSKANSFTRGKLEKLIAASDAATARYLALLDTTDREETEACGKGKSDGRGADELKAKIEKIRERKTKLQGYLEDCEKSPTGQVNLTDPDSVQLRKNGAGTVGYNIQAAVDAKHHMVAAVELTQDGNDKKQLDPMAQKAKAELYQEQLPHPQSQPLPALRRSRARTPRRHPRSDGQTRLHRRTPLRHHKGRQRLRRRGALLRQRAGGGRDQPGLLVVQLQARPQSARGARASGEDP
jgi:hypothetical protein